MHGDGVYCALCMPQDSQDLVPDARVPAPDVTGEEARTKSVAHLKSVHALTGEAQRCMQRGDLEGAAALCNHAAKKLQSVSAALKDHAQTLFEMSAELLREDRPMASEEAERRADRDAGPVLRRFREWNAQKENDSD